MSDVKYKGSVLHLGDHALDFEKDGMVILFGPQAGETLEPFCVIIEQPSEGTFIEPGNVLKVGQSEHVVTAVGSEANETFSSLGHCTVRFDGAKTPILPGTVHVNGPFPEFTAGADLVVF